MTEAGAIDRILQAQRGLGLEALDDVAIMHANGRSIITRIGLRVSLNFQDGHTIHKREAGLRVLRSFYDVFSGSLTHWIPTTGGAPRKLKPGVYPPIDQPKYLQDVGEYFGGRMMRCPPDDSDDIPLYFAHFTCVWDKQYEHNSSFEAHIPLSWAVANGFDRVTALVQEWSGMLKAVHGTTSISLLLDRSEDLQYSYFLLKKFPGFDYENEAIFSAQVNSRHTGGPRPFLIRTIGWLTVLGDVVAGRLGGRSGIRAALSPACSLLDYDGGVIIRAGAEPVLGSSEDGIIPEAYREVAKLTKPVQCRVYSRGLLKGLPEPLDNHDETMKWLERFDD